MSKENFLQEQNSEEGVGTEQFDSLKDDEINILEGSTTAAEREISSRLIQENNLSEKQADDFAKEITEKYSYTGIPYPENSIQKEIDERNRLLCLNDLHLINDQEKETLNQLNSNIERDTNAIVDELVEITKRNPEEIIKEIDNAIKENKVENLDEAKELILTGFVVRGFENSKDIPSLSPDSVKNFLDTTFSTEFLRDVGLSRILKKEGYYYNDESWVRAAKDRTIIYSKK